jgi:D-alanyl-D-alanine carboxypeptidase
VKADAAIVPFAITEDVSLIAEAAVVYDVLTDNVLYEKNADAVLPLASITKLMTALVAYELLESQERVLVPTANAGHTTSPDKTEHLLAGQLSRLALIASSNEAAYALAASAGSRLGTEDAVEQFIVAMNIRAAELNLSSFLFKNTTGLDITSNEAGAMGSARDVAKLVAYLMVNHPQLLASTDADRVRVHSETGTIYEAENTNTQIKQIPNLLASKTGYTDLAGGNLVVAFDAGFNRPVIVAVLGSTRNARFTDVLTLIEAVREPTN